MTSLLRTSWLLPDVNVWVALHHERHGHHGVARAWFDGLDEQATLVFCRQTQLGMFRLLTMSAVMGDEAITQRQCWRIYDEWMAGGRAVEQTEPPEAAVLFRGLTSAAAPNPKTWTDSYLAAFAEAAGLTLVTFDKALAGRVKGAVLL